MTEMTTKEMAHEISERCQRMTNDDLKYLAERLSLAFLCLYGQLQMINKLRSMIEQIESSLRKRGL